MKKLFLILITLTALALVFSACQSTETVADTTDEPVEKAEIIHNSAEEFEALMEGEYLLLDVRTQAEYDEVNIDGATLIPVSELEIRLNEIKDYKDKRVLVYCRSGNRSVTASNILIENGFTEVHNLNTGINGWLAYKEN